MSLILIEGFSDVNMQSKWDTGSSIISNGSASPSPRVPGGFWGRLSTAYLDKSFTATSKVVVGYGMNYVNATNIPVTFYGDGGTVAHVTVMRNTSTGQIEIRRGTTSGTLLASSSEIIPLNIWSYIECSATISDTVGEVHVRLNGESSDAVNFTGDTKNGGTNSTIDKIRITSGSNSNYYSDIYILNGDGSANNDFLGDVAVQTLSPNANGNSSQLTGSDGNPTDNYLLVDEKPFTTTDYTYSSTSGHKDTYGMADLPAAASTVFGVQVNASMRKDDAGLGQARYVLRSGGTDYVGSTETLTTTATTYVGLYEQDPATTSAWTVSGVNSAEAGMEVV